MIMADTSLILKVMAEHTGKCPSGESGGQNLPVSIKKKSRDCKFQAA
ncbi:hypothetical protein CLS_01040 [[Clostridium] cf. saccharolyticum K10]|nr:hypothetical protein CLS_01040 [[Clostridium] cf. saccharolyticum K10]